MAVGDVVLVKSFPGDPVVRCIFGEDDAISLICLQADYQRWAACGAEPLVVPCPKERVFVYQEEFAARLMAAAYSGYGPHQIEELWKLAKPYYTEKEG